MYMYVCTFSFFLPHTCSSSVDLEVAIPAMEDHVCFSVGFPEGSHVADCSRAAVELPFVLEFTSSKPVTKTGHLLFSDSNTGKR